jgi:integrase
LKKLGNRLELFSANELKEFLIKSTKLGSDDTIDFIAFSRTHIDKIKSKQKSRASVLQRTLNSFVEFYGREKISVTEITSKGLIEYQNYLLNPRTIKRMNQYGKEVIYNMPPCISSGVHDYMGNIRTLFNAAKKEFNDDDKGEIRIVHNPFTNYEIPKKKNGKHRNLDIKTIRALINCPDLNIFGSHGKSRANLARDCFALSFYLVGMNTVDLYKAYEYKSGRINYNRSKTEERRDDDALISIKVEPEAMELFEKYRDKTGERVFCFYQMYSTMENFNSAVNKGLKQIGESLKIDVALSSYYARHSWATIARNDCGVSKDDIHLALNHVEEDLKVTDIYIAKDWSIIDNANRKVINYLKG